jgi:predicted CopG family antitoxin
MVKTITIRNEIYNKLAKLKRENESFSDLFERLIESQDSKQLLVRLKGTVDFKDKDRLLSEIYASRAGR